MLSDEGPRRLGLLLRDLPVPVLVKLREGAIEELAWREAGDLIGVMRLAFGPGCRCV